MVDASELQTYGVRQRATAENLVDLRFEELRRNGFTVLQDVFSSVDMIRATELIDSIYSLQVEEIGGKQLLASAKDENIVRCPLGYDEAFLKIATNGKVLEVIGRALGDSYILLMQNGIINRPQSKQYQVRWHRDLNYQHWTSSRPLAVSFLVCIDRFSVENGATWVLPGSHLFESFPSNAFVRKHEVPLEATSGSVIVFDAMTYHRAGENSTDDQVRRALNNVVGSPFMNQQISLPEFLAQKGRDYRRDKFLAVYLGYRWSSAASPAIWRQRHILEV